MTRYRRWSYFGSLSLDVFVLADHAVCSDGLYSDMAVDVLFPMLLLDIAGCLDSELL